MRRELIEVYAIRAREFSDAVARLGQYSHVGPEFLEVWQEIQQRLALCNAAGEELGRYIDETSARGELAPASGLS
ncbi:MAG TPA: hypothetical protein VH640_22695 [Bryobacteraceae bacterium]|jgi:hypothetical protein